MKKGYKIKNGQALLMVLLIITIVGAVALTLSRSLISGSGFTVSIANAMSADSASRAGIEDALLRYKNDEISSYPDLNHRVDIAGDIYAIVDVTIYDTTNQLIQITSVGHSGQVVKKHILYQRLAP